MPKDDGLQLRRSPTFFFHPPNGLISLSSLICKNENLLQQESYLFNKKDSSDPNPLDTVIFLKTHFIFFF
jgi:hypothetical protein